jgi:trigger factor
MSATIKKHNDFDCEVSISFPVTKVEEVFQVRIAEIARSKKIKGFRMNKSGKHLEQIYGASIRGEAVQEMVQKELNGVISANQLEPISMPEIQMQPSTEDKKNISFVATFERMPEIKLEDLSVLTLVKPEVSISENEIDEAIEKIRTHFADWSSVDRVSQKGDRLKVDYVGFPDAKAGKEKKIEQQMIVLGSNNLPDAFDEYLVNRRAGDTVTFPVSMPGSKKELPPTDISVKIHNIQEAVLPKLDAEFAKNIGIDVGEGGDFDMEKFRKQASKPLEREKDQLVKKLLTERLFVLLTATHANTVPVSASLFKQYMTNLTRQQPKDKAQEILDLSFDAKDPRAEKGRDWSRLQIVLMQLHKDHPIEKVSEDDVYRYLAEMGSQYSDPEAFVRWYLEDETRKNNVKQDLMQEKLVDFVLGKVRIQSKTISYPELKETIAREEA